ncbi:beta-glucosidase (plasmid) [Rhizobium sp. CB3090]|uniref:beta-glucosidase n=1 Tax=Rhizobium sp. CB3090 TaxID=3039156 RepID=UPI0024B08471|nr:glycoside hydrolase family 3 protein [Rhizobium sp. CB3090]WFU12876.1 beta-glucosidase [Rhizobium sp. CB3090]
MKLPYPPRGIDSMEEDAKWSWLDTSLSPDVRAAMVVETMTDDEKFSWLYGPMAVPFGKFEKPEGALGSAGFFPAIERLGIPARQETDATLGIGNLNDVRPGDTATALPSSLLLGASFDPAIAFETGALIGSEAHAKGFNVILAGGANLVREPRAGRNFENVSEDPLLTGVIAGNSIAGIQSQSVVSTVKHFVLNAEETGRVMLSADIEEAALRESDLLAFQIAIEIGSPGSVMPGYNLVNGEYASENGFLLNTVLKGEWGFPGWVMSDWGATHSTEKAIRAGLDVQSGANLDTENFFGAALRAAVERGDVPGERINDSLRRQLRSLFAIGAVDRPAVRGGSIDYDGHRKIAQRAAEAGIVLLRNENAALPIAKGKRRLLVVGRHADLGVLSGGGSSSVTPTGSVKLPGVSFVGLQIPKVYHPSSPLHAIKMAAAAEDIVYLDGEDIDAAAKAARGADAVIVFAGAWRTEGMDAPNLDLPDGQDVLIDALAGANPATIVVLETGGPVLMPWFDRVAAVVLSFFSGNGGGEAIARVLFGHVNPSGRLPVTFPASLDQLPRPGQIDPASVVSNPGVPVDGNIVHVSYDIEGADVGYRWFEREKLIPLLPFGYGLSYTRFSYGDLVLREAGGQLQAIVSVTNEGPRVGAEVVQLYARFDAPTGFVSRLVGFAKLELAPGETGTTEMTVDPRLISRFNTDAKCWRLEAGTYHFSVRRNAAETEREIAIDLDEKNLRP